jgi:hypothetical protein
MSGPKFIQYAHPAQVLPPEAVAFLQAHKIAPESLSTEWKAAVIEVAKLVKNNPLQAENIITSAVQTYNESLQKQSCRMEAEKQAPAFQHSFAALKA